MPIFLFWLQSFLSRIYKESFSYIVAPAFLYLWHLSSKPSCTGVNYHLPLPQPSGLDGMDCLLTSVLLGHGGGEYQILWPLPPVLPRRDSHSPQPLSLAASQWTMDKWTEG